MKHRNLWITLIVIALIAVAYGSAAWYFSNLIIASDTESLAEAAADGDTPADFDAAAVSPENAIAQARMPILLIHSRTDEFTPAAHSEAIYANSDHSRTVLHVNEWGSGHASDITTDFEAYRQLFNDFMAQYVPDFGLPLG